LSSRNIVQSGGADDFCQQTRRHLPPQPDHHKGHIRAFQGPAGAVGASSSLWKMAELDEAHARWAFDEIRCGIIGMDEGLRIIRAN
jgi:hypothetical protein